MPTCIARLAFDSCLSDTFSGTGGRNVAQRLMAVVALAPRHDVHGLAVVGARDERQAAFATRRGTLFAQVRQAATVPSIACRHLDGLVESSIPEIGQAA